MVGRRSLVGRREACDSRRCRGWRDVLWVLWALWVLCWRWGGGLGLCVGGGEGAAGTGLSGTKGGLRCDVALAAESALLMPATDWLEYPESLLRSKLFGTPPVGVLSAPMPSGSERLVRTLALPGEESGEKESMATPWLWPSSEK